MSQYLTGLNLLDPGVKRYNGGTSTFTMDNNGTTNGTLLWVSGVAQIPGTDYNVSGATITTTTAAPAGTNTVVSLQLFETGIVNTVASNAVTTAKINDDAVTLAKMASGTDGNIISYDASGNPVAIATGTSGHFLKSQGAGAQPVFAADNKGAMTFINTTDISSAATYAFTATAAASYDGYGLFLQNIIPVTDDVRMWFRTSTDSGSSYDDGASDYDWNTHNYGSYQNDVADNQIELVGDAGSSPYQVGSDTNENGVSGWIWVWGPHLTAYTMITYHLAMRPAHAGYPLILNDGVGSRLSAADVDAFQILFSSGSIESGTITVYGLANA